jgi:hypothetical protein
MPLHMLKARGVKQQGFGFRQPAVGFAADQQLADTLGAGCAARFARNDMRHTSALANASASNFICVDLPLPSPPSNVMKLPRIIF